LQSGASKYKFHNQDGRSRLKTAVRFNDGSRYKISSIPVNFRFWDRNESQIRHR